jgi:membrane-associated protein
MERRHFFVWSGVGAVLWATSVTLLGYFLGNAFPVLKDHLEAAILAIVLVSVIPMAVEIVRARRGRTASEDVLDETGEAVSDLRDQAY